MAIKTSTDLIIPPAHALGVPSDVDYALRTRIAQRTTVVDAAANSTPEHVVFISPVPIIINSCRLIPIAATAANANDYAVLSLRSGDLANGALASPALGSLNTAAVSLAPGVVGVVAVGLNAAVAANQRVSIAVTKVGNGVATGAFYAEVTYQLA